eukprot:2977376-Rhodomonas_salina.1
MIRHASSNTRREHKAHTHSTYTHMLLAHTQVPKRATVPKRDHYIRDIRVGRRVGTEKVVSEIGKALKRKECTQHIRVGGTSHIRVGRRRRYQSGTTPCTTYAEGPAYTRHAGSTVYARYAWGGTEEVVGEFGEGLEGKLLLELAVEVEKLRVPLVDGVRGLP